MNKTKASTKRPRPSKYDEPIKIDSSPEAVARSLFNGKPKKKWRYLRRGGSAEG